MIYLLTGVVRLKIVQLRLSAKNKYLQFLLGMWFDVVDMVDMANLCDRCRVLLHVVCPLRHMSVLSHGEFYMMNI